MKIGEFAKKHDVTVDTVRYYIDEGLLTPFRENTQYCFTEIDDDVMDSILALKSMNFKIDEMKAYLLFQTLYTNSTFNYIGDFRQRFMNKLKENKQEIKRLEKINNIIEKRLGGEKEVLSVSRGIPINFIGRLRCPDCKESLELSNPILEHNEVIEGELHCPKCGKKYFISYGILSDEPLTDLEVRTDGLSDLFDKYLKTNDKEYIVNIRVFCEKISDIVREHSGPAGTVLFDGDFGDFLDGAILRSLPQNATTIIHRRDNVTSKFFLGDILPKNTIFYAGNMEKFPLEVDADYCFWKDYDITDTSCGNIHLYKGVTKNTRLDCFKTIFYDKSIPFPDEDDFLRDMEKIGWIQESVYRTGRLVMKQSSSDWNTLDRKKDIEMEYCLYSFKADTNA